MKLPKYLTRNEGFTLIELLVVIAVLGILASVVLVAINPQERIAEANDAGVKNDVAQIATALESYYTNNLGDYDGLTTDGTAAVLVSQGYIKRDPGGISIAENDTSSFAYGTINAATASCDSGTGTNKFWVYRTATGVSQVECTASGVPAL